jgi:hypothetical protein
MKILVTTSNQQLRLLKPHATLFNRYWPGQQVTILGFDTIGLPRLPANFEYVSLGRQDDFGRYWTDPLIPYINELDEDYFVLMMGDFLLTDYVEIERLKALESEIINGDADKVVLDTHLSAYTVPYKPGIRELRQEAPYRTTLHPAIWRKEYFLKFLKPKLTAWQFEIHNMPESQRDEARILLPEMPPGITTTDPAQIMRESAINDVVRATNVYVKGVPIPHPSSDLPFGAPSSITKEDILFICQYVNPKLCEQLDLALEDGKRYK